MLKSDSIDPDYLPVHIGIIMDGNGRWARNRGKSRRYGHREGLKAAKRVVKTASDIGIKNLSLYVFSTENWRRAESEVSYLMLLIKTHLKKELDFYRENRIRVIHSGDLEGLPPEIIREIENVARDTATYEGLTVNLAINYGGRDEIVRAIKRWLKEEGKNGKSIRSLRFGERDLSRFLDHPELPDPDLIIRTSGEMRTSNFLLWESSYSELYFSPKMWPDWMGEDLLEAISCYQRRERRFGTAEK
jgi:undecaprenyl diphosphate synthase